MEVNERSMPPEDLWLIFDFSGLTIKELKIVYHLIKNDTGVEDDIIQLHKCYLKKKEVEIDRESIPKMKKPLKKSKQISSDEELSVKGVEPSLRKKEIPTIENTGSEKVEEVKIPITKKDK